MNRDSISIQDLRELHVETAGRYGVLLNASSRFSRNVEDRPESSGRIHAAREDRVLPEATPVGQGGVFPLYGASRREELTIGELREARADLAAQYRAVAAQFEEFAPKLDSVPTNHLLRRLERAAELVENNETLTEENLAMADETAVQDKPLTADERLIRDLHTREREAHEAHRSGDETASREARRRLDEVARQAADRALDDPKVRDEVFKSTTARSVLQSLETDEHGNARPEMRERMAARNALARESRGERPSQIAEGELAKMQRDIADIYTKSRENIDKIDDEAKKTEAEKALANIMREFDQFIAPKDRERFGKGIERENIEDVSLDDKDPVRQRHAAAREAEEGKAPATTDERTQKARERLERADREARTLFANRGMNPDIAMQRIRDAPNVDRETREKWMDRDIQSLARTGNISEKDARETTQKTYRDASRLYAKARDDIRDIKLEKTQTPAVDRSKSAQKPITRAGKGRDKGIDR